MSDPVKAIARQLQRRCAGLAATTIRGEKSDRWRSLLFDGARHQIVLDVGDGLVDDALEAIRDMIETDGLTIIGHLIAEIRVAEVDRSGDGARVVLDALTIESPPAQRHHGPSF